MEYSVAPITQVYIEIKKIAKEVYRQVKNTRLRKAIEMSSDAAVATE